MTMGLWSWLTDPRPQPADDETEHRSLSIGDPAVAMLLGMNPLFGGPVVSENTALTLSAVYRAVSLIAGSIAALPLRTLVEQGDQKVRSTSFLDNPHGRDGLTAFEWKELVMVHLLLHGNAYLQHLYNGAGAVAALHPVHPSTVAVEAAPSRPGGKIFKVSQSGAPPKELDGSDMTQVMGASVDGIVGISPITAARLSMGIALSGDRATSRLFSNGAMISGLVTPAENEDLSVDEAKQLKDSLSGMIAGTDKAGDIAVMNRRLRFDKWSMTPADAQFLQSRSFQIEEIARWYGLPPHLLGQVEKQTSWGTGVAEQNLGLARYTLTPWTTRIDERLSRLLVPGKSAEFDYSAFLKPAPKDEIELLIKQVDAGLLTLNEARRIRNMPPVPDGDRVRQPGASPGNSSDGTPEVAA